MSVKRLGAGPGNKLAAITAAVSGNLEEVTRQLERPVDRTRGVFERVSLESVRPDGVERDPLKHASGAIHRAFKLARDFL